MTVSAQSPVITYTANGSATDFAYPFLVILPTDLKVYFNNIEVTTGFVVSGTGVEAGGTVAFTSPPANGTLIKLLRSLSLDRTTDYVEGGALRAAVLDADIDRVVMMLQDVRADAASLVEFAALLDETRENIDNIEANAAAAAASAEAALVSENNADASEAAAAAAASTATTQAGIAITQAGIATTQAANASTSASTAATQAGIATTQAGSASTSASTATTQAGIATAQAGTATTQATNASSSAAAAAASALDAANRVPKTSNTGSAVMPAGTSAQRDAVPASGYTRFNTTLQSLEVYNDAALAWVPAGQGATGAVGNPVFYENDKVITGDYTVPSNKNAMSAGPIEIALGVDVTLAGDAIWRIV
jgi:hypothetical protein